MKWHFKSSPKQNELPYSVFAKRIMPLLGLEEDEIMVFKDRVEGNPTLFTLKFITPVRMSVHDFILKKETDGISIKIRFYKLFIIAAFPASFGLFGGLLSGFNGEGLIICISIYFVFVAFFGVPTLIELSLYKMTIRDVIEKN